MQSVYSATPANWAKHKDWNSTSASKNDTWWENRYSTNSAYRISLNDLKYACPFYVKEWIVFVINSDNDLLDRSMPSHVVYINIVSSMLSCKKVLSLIWTMPSGSYYIKLFLEMLDFSRSKADSVSSKLRKPNINWKVRCFFFLQTLLL